MFSLCAHKRENTWGTRATIAARSRLWNKETDMTVANLLDLNGKREMDKAKALESALAQIER